MAHIQKSQQEALVRISQAAPQVVTPKIQTPVATEKAPAAPQDSVEVNQGSDGANMMKMAVTGLTGVAIAIPTAYAGLAGGAIVGSLAGGALGPVLGAVQGHGVLSALGQAWSSAGSVGHAGAVLGGALALAGSAAAASKLGNATGHLLGIPKNASAGAHINWKNPVNTAVGTVLMTTGIASGTVGGMALVGGATAAGTILDGLVHNGFSAAALSGVGHNALIGGGIGAIVAGTIGTMGAMAATKLISRNLIDPAANHKSEGTAAVGKFKALFAKMPGERKDAPTPLTSSLSKQALSMNARTSDWTDSANGMATYLSSIAAEPTASSTEKTLAQVTLNATRGMGVVSQVTARKIALQTLNQGMNPNPDASLARAGADIATGIQDWSDSQTAGITFLSHIAKNSQNSSIKAQANANLSAVNGMDSVVSKTRHAIDVLKDLHQAAKSAPISDAPKG